MLNGLPIESGFPVKKALSPKRQMNLLPLWREFFPARLWLSDSVKGSALDALPQRYFGMKYKEDDAMKRKLLLFCTAIFLICFFSGCVVLPGNNTSDSDGSKIPVPKRICAPILQAVKPGRNILFSPVHRLSSRKDRSWKDRSCMQSYRQIKKQP